MLPPVQRFWTLPDTLAGFSSGISGPFSRSGAPAHASPAVVGRQAQFWLQPGFHRPLGSGTARFRCNLLQLISFDVHSRRGQTAGHRMISPFRTDTRQNKPYPDSALLHGFSASRFSLHHIQPGLNDDGWHGVRAPVSGNFGRSSQAGVMSPVKGTRILGVLLQGRQRSGTRGNVASTPGAGGRHSIAAGLLTAPSYVGRDGVATHQPAPVPQTLVFEGGDPLLVHF